MGSSPLVFAAEHGRREEEMAFFDERDWFYGYRVVMRDDGTWWYCGIGVE